MLEEFLEWWHRFSYRVACLWLRLVVSDKHEVARVKKQIREMLERALIENGNYVYDFYWYALWPYRVAKEHDTKVQLSGYHRRSMYYDPKDPDVKMRIELDNKIFKIIDRLLDLRDELRLVIHYEHATASIEVV